MKRQLFNKVKKPVIRSDNGPQFISHRFAEACEQFGLLMSVYRQKRLTRTPISSRSMPFWSWSEKVSQPFVITKVMSLEPL